MTFVMADFVEPALVGLVALGLASRLASSVLVAEAALMLALCALTFACDALRPRFGLALDPRLPAGALFQTLPTSKTGRQAPSL